MIQIKSNLRVLKQIDKNAISIGLIGLSTWTMRFVGSTNYFNHIQQTAKCQTHLPPIYQITNC